MTPHTDVAIVGAGLAGLTAARALTAAGRRPLLLDKDPHPGGRCATLQVGDATVDTGAQFFTVRSEAFAREVRRWSAEGCPIRVWSHGFARAPSIAAGPAAADPTPDGHPRRSVVGGMNRLPAHLARDLDVRTSTRVTAVRSWPGGWSLEIEGGEAVHARAVLLTPPLPQTLALLASGEVTLPGDLEAGLRARSYQPCLTLMLVLDGSPGLPPPGGVQFAAGPVSWIGDNLAKGASAVPSLTVHASGAWSEVRDDQSTETISAALLDLVRPWLGTAHPWVTGVFRWRYAQSFAPADRGAVAVCEQPGPLLVAGDTLAGAKVEGAVTSGLAAAERLLDG